MSKMLDNKSDFDIVDIDGNDLDAVGGGFLPFLALAVAATYVEFSFVSGVFDGAAASARH